MDQELHNRYRRSFASTTPTSRTSIDGLSPYGRRLVVPARTPQPPQAALPTPAAIPKIVQQPATPTQVTKPMLPTPTPTPTPKVVQHHVTSQPAKPRSIALPSLDLPASNRLALKKRSLLRRLISKQAALAGAAVCLVALSVYVSLDSLRTNQEVKAAHTEQAAQNPTAPQIDETPLPPDTIANYKVAPSMPRVISIESIGVKARVLRVGVTANNAMDTPKNSNDTGWYDGSAKPGEAGAMIMNAHYSGLTQPGVFHKLDRLKAGAIITIEKGDGTTLKFAVKKVERMSASKVPMDQLLVSPDPKAQSLNLITCAGNYDPRTQTYDERVVVYAAAVR